MGGKIAGSLSQDARVIVIREDNWTIESNTTETAGSYEITGLIVGEKLVVARRSDGEVISYGDVTAVYSFTAHDDEIMYLDFEDSNTIDDKSVGGHDNWSISDAGTFSQIITTSGPKYGTRCLAGINGKYASHAQTSYLQLGTGDFTFQFWYYPVSTQHSNSNNYTPIFGGGAYGDGVLFHMTDGSNILRWYQGGYLIDTSTAVNINAWNHVRFVRQSGVGYLFLDGIQRGSNTSTLNLTSAWTNGFNLLDEPDNSRENDGKLDAFQILSSSLGTGNFTPGERAEAP